MQALIDRIGLPLFVQITIESWNILFITITICTLLLHIHHDRKARPNVRIAIPMTGELLTFFLAVIIYNICDVLDIAFGGMPTLLSAVVIRCGVFCYYAVGGFLTLFFLQVIKKQIAKKMQDIRLERLIVGFQIVQIPMFLLLLVTPFTNALYCINEKNEYIRSWGYVIWQCVTFVTLAFIIGVIIRQWQHIDRNLKKVIAVATILPVFGVVLGYYMHLSMNNIMVSLTTYIMFMIYEQNKVDVLLHNMHELEEAKMQLVEKQLLLEQSKNQTLMAQIQPHFINNSLMALRAKCVDNPEIYESLTNFSLYLRSHFEALGDTRTISFEQEMLNIEAYLTLEQQNYKDRLNVEYDIECDDFSVPALSVQPLVENAVRHGIATYEKGGIVQIRSYRRDGTIYIEVINEGFGKNHITVQQEKRKGIGIENVRVRLQSMCHGELELQTEEHRAIARITIREDEIPTAAGEEKT